MFSHHTLSVNNNTAPQFLFIKDLLNSEAYRLFYQPLAKFISFARDAKDEIGLLMNIMSHMNENMDDAYNFFNSNVSHLKVLGAVRFDIAMPDSHHLYFLFGFAGSVQTNRLHITIRQIHVAIQATSNQENAAAQLKIVPAVFKQLLGRFKLYHADKIPLSNPSINDIYVWLKYTCTPDHYKKWFREEYDDLLNLNLPVLFDEAKFNLAMDEPTLLDAAANLCIPVLLLEFCLQRRFGLTDFEKAKTIFYVSQNTHEQLKQQTMEPVITSNQTTASQFFLEKNQNQQNQIVKKHLTGRIHGQFVNSSPTQEIDNDFNHKFKA
ncbi:MAG: hypothetical protein A3F11_00300 [Gammaproteobacteria bacterium RIFCSPHIGHO2_12_FULL_37_14]|nr:MAG: hypothetical protein A3F11_00300 [Gammaproteobacteria bacterium RIFCSPHIGHO2_12_FULL_37_14]